MSVVEFQGGLGPKKQDLWPITNTLEENHCILRITSVCQQLGMILENKAVQKLKLSKNNFNKICAHKILFLLIEKRNQKDSLCKLVFFE